MARVFVSHSSVDDALADEVHRWLAESDNDVFLDRNLRDGIAVGERWEPRLHERLRWADAVVCVLTKAYVDSTWCTAELAIAQSRGARILPILAEPHVKHPLLSSLQHAGIEEDLVDAQTRIVEALQAVDTIGGVGWPDDRSPFPGLRSFDSNERQVFFGRSLESKQLAASLRSSARDAEAPVLLVVGPSGCGKSSLVRAGLLPLMSVEPSWWTLPPLLPGKQPVAALARELAAAARQVGLSWSVFDIRRRLNDNRLAEIADDLLLAVRGPRRENLLLGIDQFEELLTQSAASERLQFGELLQSALSGPVRAVGTLRPEFLEQLLLNPELAGLAKRVHTIQPLSRDTLRMVIEGPAQLAGIAVDDELVTQLVADTENGEALPLLAFTLSELSQGVGRGGRLLSGRYEQLGGVQGALARHADAALAEATSTTGRAPGQVIRQLLQLVTVDERGRPTRRRVRRTELAAQTALELDCFVAHRLLLTDLDDDGRAVVGVAHEALLSAWPPLAEAIDAAATALRARRVIDQAADDWARHGREPGRLWERGQLAAALADTGARFRSDSRRIVLRKRFPVEANRPTTWWRPDRVGLLRRVLVTDHVHLDEQSIAFLHASSERDRRLRRRSITVLSILLVAALLAASTAFIQQRAALKQQQAAEEGQRLAVARLLLARADIALGSDPRTALRLGEAAQRIHPDPATRAGLVHSLLGSRFSGVLQGHSGQVYDIAFAPDGLTLATASADRTVLLWDVTDFAHPRRLGDPLSGHADSVAAIAFSPDGDTLITASFDESVLLWDVTDPTHVRRLGEPLTGHTGPVAAAAFSADGHTLVTADVDGTVRLWEVTDRANPRVLGEPLAGHTDAVAAVAFTADGHTLATASWDKSVLLWNVTDRNRPKRLGGALAGQTAWTAVAFTRDGHALATASADNSVILWDVTDPARSRRIGDPLTGHTAPVNAVAFTPDRRTLATASADKSVILWDLTDPAHPRRIDDPLTGHTASVDAVAFGPDGRMLATGSGDKTALLWDIARQPGPRLAGGPLTSRANGAAVVAFMPSGRILATAGDNNTVELWDVTDPTHPRQLGEPLTGYADTVSAVAFNPDGHTMAAATGDKILLWDVTDPIRPQQLGKPLTGHTSIVSAVAFTPDGHTMATATGDKTLLWDVTDPIHPRQLGELLTGDASLVSAVAFNPIGHTLATAIYDETVLWDVTDPAYPRQLGEPLTGHASLVSAVGFTPDGNTLATASRDQSVLLWDVTDPANPRRLGDPLIGHTAPVIATAFAPDGRTLATGGWDHSVLLWDLTDQARPRLLGKPLSGYADAVTAVTFAPDGRTLATTSNDKTVRLWNLDDLNSLREDPLQRACSLTQNGLSRDEWARLVPELPYLDSCAE